MSRNARRREWRRLKAFERALAPELEEARLTVAEYAARSRALENERNALALKLRQCIEELALADTKAKLIAMGIVLPPGFR